MGVRIFWATVVGFAAGVFLASFVSLGWAATGGGLLIAGAIGVFAALDAKTRTSAALCAVFFLASAAGIARMHLADSPRDAALDQRLGQEVTLEGVAVREPDVRENSTRIHIQTEVHGATESLGVLAVVPLYSTIVYGDKVSVTGTLTLPERFETDTGRAFNYPAFLKKDGILYTLSFALAEKIGENEGNLFVKNVLWIKQKYLEGLQRALPEPSAALAGGITVGDKRALGGELSDMFRTTALIHIVVLSGYNIMVVINALSKMFAWAPQSVRFGVGGMVAISFVIMTGAAAPSVRAAAMAIIGMAGRATKRTYLTIRALAFVAFGMILWNPYVLAFDPGFQLSIAATWGIVMLTPNILPFCARLARWPRIQEIAATTIATQTAVLPLLLYQSGAFSLFSLPANMLVLAALPAAMFFSILASIAGLVFGLPALGAVEWLAPTVALPAHLLLSYFVGVADFLAHLPLASIPLGTFNFVWVVAAYAALLWYVRRKNSGSSAK